MRGWVQNRFADFLLAWGDAGTLIARHGDMGQREAVLRAQDPRGEDGPRSSRHWRRVARIIAWKAGEDTIASIQHR